LQDWQSALFCRALLNKMIAVDPKVEQQIRALAQKYDDAIKEHDSFAIALL
jgi:hypothetical protein